MTSTYTFAILHVSKDTFEEIHRLLKEANYDHVFHDEDTVIDMSGIAIKTKLEDASSTEN